MPIGLETLFAALAAAVAGAALAVLAVRRRGPRHGAADAAAHAELTDRLHQLEIAKGQVEVRLETLQQRLAEAQARETALEEKLAARDRALAEKDAEIARKDQALKDQQAAQADWDKTRQEFLAMARSSVSATASEVSSKLLKDHKQENETAKKEAEERVKKLTEQLTEKVSKLGEQFVRVDELSRSNSESVDKVLRALSAPGTSGHAAQTTLGNVLGSFGLTEGRDYVLEHTVMGADDNRLRPDAVVFMPSDTVLVVDSKSSKYLLELAEAEEQGEEALAEARTRFKKSMNQHLRDLTTKDYRGAVSAALRAAGREAEARQVLTLMWLPNEGAVEKLAHADPTFADRAAQSGIYLAGPSGLWSAIGIAEARIRLAKQQDNLAHIADEAAELVDRVAKMLEHADKMGTAIQRAADSYNRLAGSANTRVLPTMQKMGKHGLSLPAKGLPQQMKRLQVMRDTVDAESEPVPAEEPPRLHAPED